MLLSFLAMTDKPIDNLQKTVSTQILQTASNIKLLGENIDKVNGRTTQLGIELDAEKKSIRAYVDEQDKALDKSFRSEISMTKNEIMASVTEKDKALETELSSRINIQAGRIDILNSWQTSTEKRMSSIETSIDSIKLEVSSVKDTAGKTSAALAKLTITVDGISTAVGKAATKKELSAAQDALSSEIDSNDKEVRKYIDGIDSGIRSDYGTTVSLVKQKSDSWSVAAGAFYSDGTLRECGGLSVSTYFTNLFNKKITLDASGNVKNISKSGLLVTADKTALETKISNVDGKIISSATIETMISNGISKASIRADQISLEGVVTANKYFKINTDGSMETIAGKIAGMKISGDGLTNEGFDNDAYIVLRNDTHKIFAGIGGNVLPASTGARAVARFTNEESSKFFGDVNYSVVCGAKGAVTNVALDMTLGGYITGLRIKTARLSSGGSSYGSPVAIPKGTNSVILGGSGYYQLPTMSKEDDGYVVFIKNDYDGAVHLRSNTSVTSKGLIRTSFILYNKGSNTTDLVIDSRGDAMIFVYHRDVNIAGEENTKVGCWTQYKCPRDW